MRAWTLMLPVFVLVGGCDSAGTHATEDAGSEASVDATTGDGSDDASTSPGSDAGDGALQPCADYPAGTYPSDDCVFVGACPLDCLSGTGSEYACAAEPGDLDATPTGPAAGYPAVFTVPTTVHIIDYHATSYPWGAGAFLSCAPLTCVRWSAADHADGGSAWPLDPCADAGTAVQAWACPPSPGVVPPPAGCVNAGDAQRIGGADAGTAVNTVWCCPPAPPSTVDGGDAGDAGAAADGSDDADASDGGSDG